MTRDEFASLALSYLEEATAYARRLCRSDWDADDLVQATYVQAFRKWQDLEEPARCRAWLFRITRNLQIDGARRASARPELRLVRPGDSKAPKPVVSAETVERTLASELEDALRRLPEEQRNALLLSDVWGFRYDEISQITRTTLGTVRSRISRARSRLSRILTSSPKRTFDSRGPS